MFHKTKNYPGHNKPYHSKCRVCYEKEQEVFMLAIGRYLGLK